MEMDGQMLFSAVKNRRRSIMNIQELYQCTDDFLEKLGCEEKSLIAVLQAIQEKFSYLPREVFPYLSRKMGLSEATIYGVATFYAQFALSPKGEYDISVCLGTACYVKGSGDVFDKLQELLGIGADECTPDGRFSLSACRCIGACGLAPVMTVNSDVYGRLTPDEIPGILAKYGK